MSSYGEETSNRGSEADFKDEALSGSETGTNPETKQEADYHGESGSALSLSFGSGFDDDDYASQRRKSLRPSWRATSAELTKVIEAEEGREVHLTGSRKKRPVNEDPISHRIIEKRRRDRMNNCLADLSRLIPSSYLKKGRGRIEKTEIIEMAIKHMKHLQMHSSCRSIEKCELIHQNKSAASSSSGQKSSGSSADPTTGSSSSSTTSSSSTSSATAAANLPTTDWKQMSDQDLERNIESFRLGYHECMTEMLYFMEEKVGMYSGDPLRINIFNHLKNHYEKLNKVKSIRQQRSVSVASSMTSSSDLSSASSNNSSGYGSGSGIVNNPTKDKKQRQLAAALPASRLSESPFASLRSPTTAAKTATTKEDLETSSTTAEARKPQSDKPKHTEATNSGVGDPPPHKMERKVVRAGIRSFSESHEALVGYFPGASPLAEEPENLTTSGPASADKAHQGAGSQGPQGGSSDEHSGKYKFKANMRERFSHQRHPGTAVESAREPDSSGPVDLAQSGKKDDRREEEDEEKSRMSSRKRSHDHLESSSTYSQMDTARPTSPLKLLSYAAAQRAKIAAAEASAKSDHVNSEMDIVASTPPPPSSSSTLRESKFTSTEDQKQPKVDSPAQTKVLIFTLHPRGTYYVPLYVDYGAIAHHLLMFTSHEDENSIVLHPITINVNFGGSLQATAVAAASTEAANSTTSSSTQILVRPVPHDQKPHESCPTWHDPSDPLKREDQTSHIRGYRGIGDGNKTHQEC